jgi:hypothetical protein
VGFADPRARGGGFIGQPREPRRAGPGQRAGRGRAVLWPNSGSSPSLARGRGPPRQASPACQREREGKKRGASGGRTGPGEEASRLGQLSRAGRKGRKEERPAGLGPRGRKRERGKRKREWAGPKEKKSEKKNCTQIYLNLNL